MIIASFTLSLLCVLAPVRVTQWSNAREIDGEIVSVSLQGIEIGPADTELENPPTQTVPWYELKGVEPADPRLRSYEERAVAAWRAHSRRARGDLPGALPIYSGLRNDYLFTRGQQSMDVCMGLTQCLLDAGKRTEAIEPMLAWFVAAKAHSPGTGRSDPFVHAQTLLPIGLPPVFRDQDRPPPALPSSALISDRERLLHAYYTLGCTPTDESEPIIDEIDRLKRALRARDPGLVLMEQVVFARAHPQKSKRNAARDSLRRRARTQRGTWTEAWARLGLGAAMLVDDDPLERERGVIELIHVVVRLNDVNPGLTLLGAGLASDYLESTGRASWGAMLMHDAKSQQIRTTTPSVAQETNTND